MKEGWSRRKFEGESDKRRKSREMDKGGNE